MKHNLFFSNPVTTENVYVFADAPHLIKLLRNHFLDSGFNVNNKLLTKELLYELMDKTKHSDLNIAYKVTFHHLNVKGTQRQKVKYATQLFSHSNSCALRRLGSSGLLKAENWEELANFLKLVNDWFNIFNSRVPRIDQRKRLAAYGLEKE